MEELFKAKRQLLEFLEENPHLKRQQARLDNMLRGAGSSHNRIALLTWEMETKLRELESEIIHLGQICGRFGK